METTDLFPAAIAVFAVAAAMSAITGGWYTWVPAVLAVATLLVILQAASP